MTIDPRKEMPHIGRGDSFKNTLTELYSRELAGAVIVEVGTTRGGFGGGPQGDGWATNAWGWYVSKYGGHVHTIDVDAQCIEQCKSITIPFAEDISYHVKTGVDFLFKDRKITRLKYIHVHLSR